MLAAIDRTLTAGGARLLERRISAPSRDLTEIRNRHEAIGFLLEQRHFCENLRQILRRCPDMDRALSRLALDRGGPRDLAVSALRFSLGRGTNEGLVDEAAAIVTDAVTRVRAAGVAA